MDAAAAAELEQRSFHFARLHGAIRQSWQSLAAAMQLAAEQDSRFQGFAGAIGMLRDMNAELLDRIERERIRG